MPKAVRNHRLDTCREQGYIFNVLSKYSKKCIVHYHLCKFKIYMHTNNPTYFIRIHAYLKTSNISEWILMGRTTMP